MLLLRSLADSVRSLPLSILTSVYVRCTSFIGRSFVNNFDSGDSTALLHSAIRPERINI